MIKVSDVKYYGVDFSKEQLKHARKFTLQEKLDAELFCSRIDNLDNKIFKNNMFDYGLFISTLHCLESKKERKNSLKEFYRILKKGGEGLISVWDSSDKRFDGVYNCGDIYMDWREEGVSHFRYYYLFDKREFLRLLCDVGFDVVEIYSGSSGFSVDRFGKKNLIVRVVK
jgi:ubiquinone/menaquinone biosynthesis C-methylase UbiE